MIPILERTKSAPPLWAARFFAPFFLFPGPARHTAGSGPKYPSGWTFSSNR